MALVLKDRVKETTTTTGTGTVTLAGASTGYQSFSAIGNANTTYYCIAGQGTSEWEVGIGTYTSSGTTLSRDTILASSNSGSAVNFSAGTKDVFVVYPAGKSINLDASGNATALGTPASCTVTNFTGTASININGTVGATTPNTGAFTTLSATGVATFSAGSAAAPAITTSGDTNTGIFFPAADTIAFTEGGAEAMRIDSSGNVGIGTSSPTQNLSVNGYISVNSNNISADNSLGFRNRIINGDMRIDQRNAGASITPTATTYSIDRWQATVNISSKASFDQTTTAPAGFTNSMLITSLSAYSVAAGDIATYRQQIEGFNIADLGWGTASAKTVIVSFWVRSSLTGTFGGSIKNGSSTRSHPFTYSISVADTWEYKTITVAGDTSGTWATDNTSGLILSFGIGVGSTTSGTAGAWAGANYNSATGATSLLATNGATFYITGVQLEVGSVATPFERRPYGTELALCQRYYQTSGSPSNDIYYPAQRWGANNCSFSIPKICAMRTDSVTITTSGDFNLRGNGANESFSAPTYAASDSAFVTLNKSGLTHDPSITQAYIVVQLASTVVNFSAEL